MVTVTKFKLREEEGGNQQSFNVKFNDKINKTTKQKQVAAPHGCLPHINIINTK